jgi:pimeloyl-ACP methyl ester carboxylesterase
MPTFEHDGAVLSYDDTGERDLPPLILLPGLSEARTGWASLIRELKGRWRIVAVDHRGHGESSHAPGTYDLVHWGADTIALCDAVVGEPAVLVGHSLGGVVAHHVAVERPDLARAVFLEDPPLYLGSPEELHVSPFPTLFAMMQTSYRRMREEGATLDDYVALVRAAPALNGGGTIAEVIGEEAAALMAEALCRLDPEIFTGAVDGTGLAAARPERPVACPATVLRADPGLGPAFTVEHERRFLATNPHATVVLVEGASHLIHDEQPGRFLAELERFLSDL